MYLPTDVQRGRVRYGSVCYGNVDYGRLSSLCMAAVSLARGLRLLMTARPKTPLRVLCIAAFDMLHTVRHAKRLSAPQLKTLAALLDFGACANAAFDNKDGCRHEYRRVRQLLNEAGIRSLVDQYLSRLKELENERPLPGGDPPQFQQVGLYREAVVRLSLAMVAVTAGVYECLDAGIQATYGDGDLNILFRIVMQCQIIDDVLDYSEDVAAGLPSFLTACESLPETWTQTRWASRGYADVSNLPRTGHEFPLRLALLAASTCTTLVLGLSRWRQRTQLDWQSIRATDSQRLKAKPKPVQAR